MKMIEKNELKISKNAFIVFCNAELDDKEWDNKLNFDIQLIYSYHSVLQMRINNKKFIERMTLSLADNPRYKKNKHI